MSRPETPWRGTGVAYRPGIEGRVYTARELRRAFAEGKKAGRELRKSVVNPYGRVKDEELYYAWLRGFRLEH